ncbi:hypothetical protein WT01_18970 [Burkholderia cepacia]|nr:hypothetical protein WS88_26790 [Burkholderia cepacia]KVL57201.1 hypothetical protein WT01_18970 [Burkholderia cepacia]
MDGDALFVRRGYKTGRAFLDMPETDFVGRIALSRCVGKTLVFALDYGSPYLKGVAIRLNPVTHAIGSGSLTSARRRRDEKKHLLTVLPIAQQY